MATLLELEDAIIDRLREEIPEANISELPLDPAEIGVAVSATQIWVAFREESFDPPPKGGVSNPLKPPSQERRITFELIVRGQELRAKGHQRIYPILDKARDALTGWMPKNIHASNGLTKPFFPTRAGFTNMGAGLWVYSQTYACLAIYTAPTRKS
jgi:Gp37 protein